MFFLGIVLLVLLATAGLALVKAGRDIEATDARESGDLGKISGFVDENLQRTRTAMDTLAQPDVTATEVSPSGYALSERATTYAVFGLGLVGVAAFVVIGLLLLVL